MHCAFQYSYSNERAYSPVSQAVHEKVNAVAFRGNYGFAIAVVLSMCEYKQPNRALKQLGLLTLESLIKVVLCRIHLPLCLVLVVYCCMYD